MTTDAARARPWLLGARCRSWLILVAWWLLPRARPVSAVHAAVDQRRARLRARIDAGRLARCSNVLASLGAARRSASSIGMALAVPLGLAIALNRHVADMFRPVLSFLQAIAGIAWVPLTIIWFGIGNGSVIFVIANTIFFASLYNTVIGVQSIPLALHRAVRSHGGRGLRCSTNLILPGALVQILLGVRTSMAYGWRALVASEMIAGSNGLGYMTMEAVQWQRTEVIILGMIVIGLMWVVMDRARVHRDRAAHRRALGTAAALTQTAQHATINEELACIAVL